MRTPSRGETVTRMFAYMRLVEGLLVAHLFLAVAFLIGSNMTNGVTSANVRARSSANSMTNFVCTCAVGFAVIGLCAFIVAQVGLFNPPCVALALAVLFLATCAIAKLNPLTREYWTLRWSLVYNAFDVWHVVVYFAMIFVSFPAANLANIGTDALAYHWAYAVDWIHAGRLTVDPFLRIPFYAQNGLMLIALTMLFGGWKFLLFIMWLMGLTTALGVCAGVRSAFREDGPWVSALSVSLALSVTYSPTYLRWLDTGYLDAMLGFFALAAILALQRAWREEHAWRWLTWFSVIAAFLIGAKVSFLPLLVPFMAAAFVSARYLKCTRLQIAVIVGALVVLASPWYVRNTILSGDPIAPVLNVMLYGRDGIDSKEEMLYVYADLKTSRDVASLADAPLRAFFEPNTSDFREYAQNALVLMLYAPTIVLFTMIFVVRRRMPTSMVLSISLLTCLIAYWLFTSSLLRYSLLFYPIVALSCGSILSLLPASSRKITPLLFVASLSLLMITPGREASDFYFNNIFLYGVRDMPQYYTSDGATLPEYVTGYVDTSKAIKTLTALNFNARLYVIGPQLNYYYRLSGIDSIGDWIGPAGVFRLYRAVDAHRAPEFLSALGVGAVIIYKRQVLGGLSVPLVRQLKRAGYCEVSLGSVDAQLYVRASRARYVGHLQAS